MIKELEEVRSALIDSKESMEEWAAYAGDYFREKWDLKGDLKLIEEAITKLDAVISRLKEREKSAMRESRLPADYLTRQRQTFITSIKGNNND